jgi:hypothetical protein
MLMRSSFLLLVVAAGLCVSCRDAPRRTRPEIAPLEFERIGDAHFIATGSWQAQPSGWVPLALVRIECHRERAECTESWAQIIADEHGAGPDRLVPEFTRYRIEEWSGDSLRASGKFRNRWAVELRINGATANVCRSYLHKRNRYSGEESWVLK